jgi:CheY-like chemotaxis protein
MAKKILVIDDDATIRYTLKQILTKLSYQVSEAEDGDLGLARVKEINPDLVITDIIMPNKDGIQFITELQKINRYIPIIAMSGGRRAVTANFNLGSAELLGAKATLSKPFTIEEIKEALQKAGL